MLLSSASCHHLAIMPDAPLSTPAQLRVSNAAVAGIMPKLLIAPKDRMPDAPPLIQMTGAPPFTLDYLPAGVVHLARFGRKGPLAKLMPNGPGLAARLTWAHGICAATSRPPQCSVCSATLLPCLV